MRTILYAFAILWYRVGLGNLSGLKYQLVLIILIDHPEPVYTAVTSLACGHSTRMPCQCCEFLSTWLLHQRWQRSAWPTCQCDLASWFGAGQWQDALDMLWHWSACCIDAFILTPSRRFLMFDVKLKPQLVHRMVRPHWRFEIWNRSQAWTHCSKIEDKSKRYINQYMMDCFIFFFTCGTPFKSQRDARLAIKLCIASR